MAFTVEVNGEKFLGQDNLEVRDNRVLVDGQLVGTTAEMIRILPGARLNLKSDCSVSILSVGVSFNKLDIR